MRDATTKKITNLAHMRRTRGKHGYTSASRHSFPRVPAANTQRVRLTSYKNAPKILSDFGVFLPLSSVKGAGGKHGYTSASRHSFPRVPAANTQRVRLTSYKNAPKILSDFGVFLPLSSVKGAGGKHGYTSASRHSFPRVPAANHPPALLGVH